MRPDRAPAPAARPTGIRGRAREAETVGRLVAAAREGEGGALVVSGEAGIGKTTLLAHASDTATGFEPLRAVGVEFEMDLPFAAVHQLCEPLLPRIGHLPGAQREALETAFGLRSDGTADPFRVGLAVLGLLTEAAGERPALCVVDDAQWLDSASARVLAFVARRVGALRVAFAFGLREVPGTAVGPGGQGAQAAEVLRGLPTLTLSGLPEGEARALLTAKVLAPLDAAVRERIIAEARGNPLALLELARGAGPAAIAGGFAVPDTDTVAGRIERSFHSRVAALPDPTRRLLLIAAAEPVGDPALLQRACTALGTGLDAAAPAETAGLLELGARVRFAHPSYARPCTGPRRPPSAGPRTRCWRGRPTGARNPTGAPGTGRWRPRASTRTSRPSWSGPRSGHRPGAGWPPRRRSWKRRPC